MLEGFCLQAAAWAGRVTIGGLQGELGCQVAFRGCHFVDWPSDKLPHPNKRSQVQDWG